MTSSSSSIPIVTEVCVDSLDSVINTYNLYKHVVVESRLKNLHSSNLVLRFELCSALHQGGLTPSFGFVASVVDFFSQQQPHQIMISENRIFSVELYVMIRSRPGLEFVTPVDSLDFKVMLRDVEMFGKNFIIANESSSSSINNNNSSCFVKGIVFGSLIRESKKEKNEIAKALGIDKTALIQMCRRASDAGFTSLTFHRAIDYLGENATPTKDPQIFIKCLQELVEVQTQIRNGHHQQRKFNLFLLTSGGIAQNAAANNGAVVDFLRSIVKNSEFQKLSDEPIINILIGGGVNALVVDKVFNQQTGGDSIINILGVHFSGKKVICPEGVPESESFWEIDSKLMEELFSVAMSKVGLMNGKL